MLIFVSVIEDGGVFREDGDAALAFELVGIHDALGDGFIGAEGSGLAKHGVDESGLAVVDVGDDGDIADSAHRDFLISFCLSFERNVAAARLVPGQPFADVYRERSLSMPAKIAARSMRMGLSGNGETAGIDLSYISLPAWRDDLFVFQRLDGVHLRGAVGREGSEDDADYGGSDQRDDHGPGIDGDVEGGKEARGNRQREAEKRADECLR